MDKAQIVIIHFNPVGYTTRDRLTADFLDQCARMGTEPIVVECAFGDQDFRFTRKDDPLHRQVRGSDELWIKENLFELGVQLATSPYVICSDGDVTFADRYFLEHCVDALQRSPVIQPWSRAHYLGPNGETITTHNSFCYDWLNQNQAFPHPVTAGYPNYYWHPGLCWAYDREVFGAMGGLIDFDVLGGGDFHMACSLTGQTDRVFPQGVSENYRLKARQWQACAYEAVRENIGFSSGTILHSWHGKISARNYETKWKIVIDNQYDPFQHIQYNADGVLQWSYLASPRLRRDLSSYLRVRSEDSIDLDSVYL